VLLKIVYNSEINKKRMEKINWKNLKEGLDKYQEIMKQYSKSKEISSSDDFQTSYRKFYGMNRAGFTLESKKEYFKLLDEVKLNKEIDFKFVLQSLYSKSGKKHFSFTTKLLATANPHLPVWDSKVRKYLNYRFDLKLKNSFKDLESCENEYNRYCDWFKDFLVTDDAKRLISQFDAKNPNVKITKMKKIDLMFWQMVY
jgi:hypothetical protein